MELFIDTTKLNTIIVTLKKGGREYTEKRKVKNHRNQLVLPIIEKLLKKHKLKKTDITSVTVNPGPGSFTGIRVGIAIAHTIRYALGIKERPIEQKYLSV